MVISIIHADTTVHIEGTTNLFDRANFMLSMQNAFPGLVIKEKSLIPVCIHVKLPF